MEILLLALLVIFIAGIKIGPGGEKFNPPPVWGATWAKNISALFKNKGIPIGFTTGLLKRCIWFDPMRRNMSPNLFSIGAPGSGKTVALEGALLTWPHSAIVLDNDGELSATTAAHRATLGPVYIVDSHGISPAPKHIKRVKWNVMGDKWLDPNDMDYGIRLDNIATSGIHQGNMEGLNRYWCGGSNRLVKAGVAAVKELHPKEEHNLRTVWKILSGDVRAYAKSVMENPKASPKLKERWISFTAGEDVKSVNEIVENTRVELSWLDNDPVADVLSRDEIYFGEAKQRPVTIYITVPSVSLENLQGYIRFTFGCIYGQLLRHVKNAVPVLVMLDEYYVLQQHGGLDIISTAFATSRRHKVINWACVQNWPEMIAIHGKLADHFVSSCGCIQWLSASDPVSADYLSNSTGTTDVFTQSETTNTTRQPVQGRFGTRYETHVSTGISVSQQARQLAQTHEVRRLAGQDMQICFIAPVTDPILCQKFVWWKTALKRRGGKNPFVTG